jgi:hypothetical protein
MLKVVSFHKEIKLLEDLISETICLIHHTKVVNAIKKLVDAHDILDLTLRIEQNYIEYNHQPPWDTSTSKELDFIRCDLIAHHADAFKPEILLPRYYHKVGSFLNTMSLRVK